MRLQYKVLAQDVRIEIKLSWRIENVSELLQLFLRISQLLKNSFTYFANWSLLTYSLAFSYTRTQSPSQQDEVQISGYGQSWKGKTSLGPPRVDRKGVSIGFGM